MASANGTHTADGTSQQEQTSSTPAEQQPTSSTPAQPNDLKLYQQIVSASSEYPYVAEAISVLSECVNRYQLSHCALSFNGGKDCTVLLHLLRAALAKNQQNISDLTIIYFKVPNEFPAIEGFMQQCCDSYKLQMVEVSGSFQEALHQIFAERIEQKQPCFDAIFMGQRRHDPYCSDLEVISQTDSGWPRLDRINVLLDWSYEQIWTFLTAFNLPYCTLYDEGYTSIGTTLDSIPNPALYDSVTQSYRPAYKLVSEEQERCGRTEKQKVNAVGVTKLSRTASDNQ